MSKPPDIWMLFQTVVSKFLRLITKKIIKNRAIFDILLIHNLGIDMVCEGDIIEANANMVRTYGLCWVLQKRFLAKGVFFVVLFFRGPGPVLYEVTYWR